MKIVLIVSAAVVLLILWLPLKMAGICSREEERDCDRGDLHD